MILISKKTTMIIFCFLIKLINFFYEKSIFALKVKFDEFDFLFCIRKGVHVIKNN